MLQRSAVQCASAHRLPRAAGWSVLLLTAAASAPAGGLDAGPLGAAAPIVAGAAAGLGAGSSEPLSLRPSTTITLPSAPAAGTRTRQPVSAPARELLLLDATVNGQRIASTVRAEKLPDGPLLVPVDIWAEARMLPLERPQALSDGTPAFALDAVAGLRYSLDRRALTLEITAPATAFTGSTIGGTDVRTGLAPPPAPGMLLNYDLSLQQTAGASSSNAATLEGIAFGGLGNLVASALLRGAAAGRSATRLDTYWRYDMPQRIETLVVGDTVGVGGGWSRPARYGGIRWGRDFSMRPGFVTMPQLSLSSEAALPSTVDVLVNNVRRISQPVQPGPFELPAVPLTSGAGELNLVVRDLLGRETVIRQSFYASPQLLAPGLTDFSFEAGRLRTGYASESHYGAGFAAGTWRQGLNPWLTGELRAEWQAERRAAGIDLAALLGNWAVARGAFAISHASLQGPDESGSLMRLGMERSTREGGATVQYQRASRGFSPFGEAVTAAAPGLRERDSLLASLAGNLGGQRSLGMTYVHQSLWAGDSLRSLGLSFGQSMGDRASLSVSVNRRLDGDRAWTASAVMSFPLDGGVQAQARMERNGLGAAGYLSAAQTAPAGPGLGWRAEISTLDAQRARAGLQLNTSQTEISLDVASTGGGVSTRAGARGTLGWLAGVGFASRPVGQSSFALVDASGQAGVPVMRSHQVVAYTDARGYAFVPGLQPWSSNQIEIDPTDLPLDVEIGELTTQVMPHARAGAVVRFAMTRNRQALVTLLQDDGAPVATGTRVVLVPQGTEFLAGKRGEAWLTGLNPGRQRIRTLTQNGTPCELEFAVPDTAEAMMARLPPLRCDRSPR